MNGKEQIAAVLAHEVKNPVSLIKMNVQYIKDFCPKALENKRLYYNGRKYKERKY